MVSPGSFLRKARSPSSRTCRARVAAAATRVGGRWAWVTGRGDTRGWTMGVGDGPRRHGPRAAAIGVGNERRGNEGVGHDRDGYR
eukprot:1734374-Prymnesium_polylepis.1